MDDAVCVGVAEGARRLVGNPHRLVQGSWPSRASRCRSVSPSTYGMVYQSPPGGLARVVNRQDVGMLQPGGDLDLEQESLRADGGGELGVEHLEGDRPVVAEIVSQVDRGHAATAQLALEAVAIGQDLGKSGVECAHSFGGSGGWNVAGPAADCQQSAVSWGGS